MSVNCALIACVIALLFAGTFVIATADDVSSPTAPISRGKTNDATESRQIALIPDNKFLASLRFWEKSKSPSKPHSHSPAAIAGIPTQPQTTATAKNGVHSEQSNVAERQILTATGAAPQPSSNPYATYENIGNGTVPLPSEWSAIYEAGGNNAPTPQDVNLIKTSPSSYSFDTRDWVDAFPHQQQEQPSITENILASTQQTSLYVPTMRPSPMQSFNEDDQWNGQATTLVTHIQRAPVPSAIKPVTHSPVKSAVPVEQPQEIIPVAQPQVNLTPSYAKRLPYVQICGVVVVQANFPLTEIASILEEIELLQHDLNHYIGVPAPKEKIELCLFKNEETYINFLREVFPKAPRDRRALYVKLDDKPGTLMVQKSKDFEVDLRHEMTHAIIHASIPRVPIWLDEGLAKYFEVPISDRASNHQYMRDVRWNTKLGSVPSLDRLVKLESIDDMGPKEYRDSWAWTHFMIHRSPETHRLLAAYLQMLSTWSGMDEEFSANVMTLPGGKVVDLSLGRGREKQVPIPSLKRYLDDILGNQRETFKEHFASAEK